MQQTDIIIIGGGIVGLATAYQFSLDYPRLKITLLEKEPSLAIHQTGHNSGVLHTGITINPVLSRHSIAVKGNPAWKSFAGKRRLISKFAEK
jgi:L-2-hydroxyglutarate oxidase LhgO